MANTIDDLMPKVLAQGLLSLREVLVYPKLVNASFSALAAKKGDKIEIPTGSAISKYSITPAEVPPAPGDSTMANVNLELDTWDGASFHLTDKQIGEIDPNAAFLQIQTSAAMRALANGVNTSLGGLYTGVYGYAGTAGTTPFASNLTAATAVRKVLQKQLTPMEDGMINLVVDEDAYENALNLSQFTSAVDAGSPSVIRDAQILRKVGMNWYTTTTTPDHTTGAAGTPLLDDTVARAVGTKTLHMDGFTTKPSVGDVFTIAGDSQTYVVTGATTLVGTDSDVSFEPGLKVAIPAADGNEAVTFKASHDVNLAFHKEAIGLAIRPTEATDLSGGERKVITMQDPESGLAITLEVTRQYKQWMWEFSILYGCELIRPEYAARLAG